MTGKLTKVIKQNSYKYSNGKTLPNEAQKQKIEELWIEFSEVFAKQRFDVGYNS